MSERFKLLWPRWAYRAALRSLNRGQGFIFHGLANANLPVWQSVSPASYFVLTVHDLIPLLPASGVSVSSRLQFALMLPRALQRADAVVCISAWTYQMLVERYPQVACKVHLLPSGFDGLKRKRLLPQQPGTRHLLFVSRWEPYKGFDQIAGLLTGLSGVVLTVVTDSNGLRYLRQHAPGHLAAGRLAVRQGVAAAELTQLYARSDAYIHFSRYEGFGLPVWEALSQQTPVVFQAGHGLDPLLGFYGAVSVPPDAPSDAWVAAAETAMVCKHQPALQASLEAILMQQKGWNHTASLLRGVYNTLC